MSEQGTARRSTWLRCYFPRPGAELRLVCFPHAGGSAPFFRAWQQEISESVEVHAVAYPGRAERFTEPLVEDAPAMVAELAGELEALRDKPIALFGHSMGAFIAYETAQTVGGIAHLFLSGANAPHLRSGFPTLLDPDDEVLVRNITSLGGSASEILADPEIRELVVPALRSDLQLAEGYVDGHSGKLSCPITALLGTEDDRTRLDSVRGWAEYTTGPFALREYQGDHFYLEEHRADLLTELAATLTG